MFLIIDKSNGRQIINLDHVIRIVFREGGIVVDDEIGEEYEERDTLTIYYAEQDYHEVDGSGGSSPIVATYYGDTARAISEAIEDGLYAGVAVYTVTI